ncbi:homoserine O-acetyltransferase [Thalictrum thalictroides]|uniref:Homoserine O-acetyltransferase n=1 Tax=Thalictrum thalictroides TaxID=46969 RepID=A0A7J6WSQ9_THATH|nr:homoserine O-acetyltransferase [Thalictrum thalictroides]
MEAAAAASSIAGATTICTEKKKKTTLLSQKLHFSFSFPTNSSQTKMKKITKLLFSKSSNLPNEPKDDENNNFISVFSSPDDLSYLWKLGAGSVVGAVVIKYGSLLFPAITTPNLTQALLMISTPMLLSVLLLIRQSSMSVEEK